MNAIFTHLALHVQNLQASVDFYTDYAQLEVVHERKSHGKSIYWLGHKGQQNFVLVLIPGGPGRNQDKADFSHLGFALERHSQVDAIAQKAKREGTLIWDVKQEDFPVGYYCGVTDPDGNFVEFSFGQPLGPGAQSIF